MSRGDIGRKQKNYIQVGRAAGNDPLSLGRVLFPLRYDIFVQERFLRVFYKERQDGNVADVVTDYPQYMRDRIELVHRLRQKWGLLEVYDEAKFQRRVKKYVPANIGKLVAIWESVRRRGYLGTGCGHFLFKKIADNSTTLEGHKPPMDDSLFLTNGQHRCVALLAMGKPVIPPEWYGVIIVNDFRPIETTFEYIQRGLISEAEFVNFGRLRFPRIPTEVVTIKDFSKWAHDTKQSEWLHYYLNLYWGV